MEGEKEMCKGGVVREVKRGVTRNEGGNMWRRLREILECFKAKSLVECVWKRKRVTLLFC